MSAMIQAGKLRHSVDVYKRGKTRSASGAATTSLLLIGSRRARIRTISGGETVRGEQVQADLTHEIQMRYWEDVTTEMSLTYTDPRKGDRTFEIERIINVDERNVEMLLQCKELL